MTSRIDGLLLDPETGELVDRLLGEFVLSCVGKNDMKVIHALLASVVFMITAHCERSGQSVDEVTALVKDVFNMMLDISSG